MDYIINLSLNKKIIVLMFLALCLPYYLITPIYIGVLLYIIGSKQFIPLTKGINKLFYIFLTIIIITSLYNTNYYGLGGCFAFFLLFTLMFFYQKNTDKDLFEVCLDILIFVSFIWGVFSLFQYIQTLQEHGYTSFVIKIFAQRENRVTGSVYNANYYASALEIILLVISYKIIHVTSKKMKLFYISTFLWNVFFLVISGCRTSWLAVAIALFAFFLCSKKHKVTFVCFIIGAITFVYFMLNVDKIPRIEYLAGNFDVRELIWITAIKGIKENPFFGQGPFTYMLVYEQFAGHATQHAHNLFLEPLLSFGIVGCIPLVSYFSLEIKKIYTYYRKHRMVVALIFSAIVSTLVHGLTDYSIFFIHPGFILITLLSSYVILEGN